MSARDLFGDRADAYARHRPSYPDALFDHLAALVPSRAAAWDCGTGSGQSARGLARRFERVIATDISLRQLAHARREPRVHLVAAAAECQPIRAASVDLVTVSAALHWFDRARFFAEVRRVARPGAVLAAWSYFRSRITSDVDAVMNRFADDTMAPWWPAEFEANRQLYRDLDVPFERLPWPALEAQARMRFEDLLDYLRTWSASQAWARERGGDPVEVVRGELLRAWGDPDREREVRWPLHGLVARVSG